MIIPEKVKTIGQSAFSSDYGADNRLEAIVIPASVTSIGNGAFRYQNRLVSVTFSEGSMLQTLGSYVFADCTMLETIILPANLETLTTATGIGGVYVNGISVSSQCSYLFQNCTSLKYVDMSACEKLLEIPSYVFNNCPNMETLLLPPNLKTVQVSACGLQFKKDGSSVIGAGKIKELVIPASVTTIGAYAFSGMAELETLIFEEGSLITELGTLETAGKEAVTGIGVFYGSTSLKKVVLPKNLVQIGHNTFEGAGFETIDLPSTIRFIGAAAFKNCVNLTKADLSTELLTLGDEAFYGCTKLEQADMYFGLEQIGSQAFAYCKQLKKVYIPATVTSISGNPFMGCTGVESLELDPDSIDFVLKDGVLYDATMYTLIYYPASLTAETFQFPTTVFEIAPGAFAGAKLKALTIPDQIKQIPANAFRDSAMESITLHKSITAIGDNAFGGCANLKEIYIEGNGGTISANAFAGLAADVNIYFTGYTQAEITATAGDAWLKNASEKAHFYFKDTMPTA